MIPEDKLRFLIDRHEELESLMAEGGDGSSFVSLSREYSELTPIVQQIKAYFKMQDDMADLELMMNDPSTDSEMKELMNDEYYELKEKLPTTEHNLKISLLPKDVDDDKSIILEVRAGTGGDEASLFAGDLFRMYDRYAQVRGWKVELISESPSDLGGYKEIVVAIRGQGVFSQMKFESGVHRVQRIPLTEAGGRIHTSAATVAIMPEVEEVDIQIRPDDLRIDVFRASGAGGQHVNKTESAVRITHLPTGLAVAQQTEKSQHKNKAAAMKLLMARLYDIEKQKVDSARASERKEQVGSGDRSERIRTYNFPQGRVTDHRINLTLYKIEEVMEGTGLGELIQALVVDDQTNRLSELER